MKKLLFVLFVLLLSAYPLIAQNERTFYNVCVSNSQTWLDFQRDEITVKNLTNDFISFVSVGTTYSAKKLTNFNILKGIVAEGEKYPHPFYAYKVDDNSFFILSYEQNFGGAYYHTDKNKQYETDENKRCAASDLSQFKSLLKSYQDTDLVVENAKAAEIYNAKQKELNDQTKAVITDFMKNYKSKKIDAILEKGIVKWWNNQESPILRIYFMQPSYDFPRNDLGIVLRKTVSAYFIYKWKPDGKCYLQWCNFGYESLGGGAFNDEVGSWVPKGNFTSMPGDRQIFGGKNYEVDCAGFQK